MGIMAVSTDISFVIICVIILVVIGIIRKLR
jgi:hypothetical protein